MRPPDLRWWRCVAVGLPVFVAASGVSCGRGNDAVEAIRDASVPAGSFGEAAAFPRIDAAPGPVGDTSAFARNDAGVANTCSVSTDTALSDVTPACGEAPRACAALAIPDDCLFTPLRESLSTLASGCDVNCGDAKVGVINGCITDVVGVAFLKEEALACLRRKLVGTRWACAGEAGWKRFYLGSCTLAVPIP